MYMLRKRRGGKLSAQDRGSKGCSYKAKECLGLQQLREKPEIHSHLRTSRGSLAVIKVPQKESFNTKVAIWSLSFCGTLAW